MACVILVKNRNFLNNSSSKEDPRSLEVSCNLEPDGRGLVERDGSGVAGLMVMEGLLVEDFP